MYKHARYKSVILSVRLAKYVKYILQISDAPMHHPRDCVASVYASDIDIFWSQALFRSLSYTRLQL
jgi:hypothetical protein